MSSDEEMEEAAPAKGMSKSLGLRMQKKLLGMGAKKTVVKAFIDDNTGELLDNLYALALQHLGETKPAKKVLKDLIKIMVKLGLLYRKNQLNGTELAAGEKMRSKIKMTVMTMSSYYDVAFTYDETFLTGLLNQSRELLQSMIARHLTDKSKARVENVFGVYGSGELLTKLYNDESYKPLLDKIIVNLNKMLEDKAI